MAVNTKAVKTRIGSVKNTKKITRAMQMIAAVKMRKAVEAALRTKNYAELAGDLLENLGRTGITHPLAEERKNKKELIVLITSNRGLCGSYNSNVLRHADKYIKGLEESPDVLALGKKAAQFAKKRKLTLVSFYEKMSENFEFEQILPIARSTIADFTAKTYDRITIIYTNYVSGLLQKADSRQLLPITASSVKKLLDELEDMEEVSRTDVTEDDIAIPDDEYEFEPDKQTLLNTVLPMLVEVQFYQTVLESAASEHSSRMIAMKNATEAADEMIDDLTLEFNKGRQAAITQEIAEITGGAAAL